MAGHTPFCGDTPQRPDHCWERFACDDSHEARNWLSDHRFYLTAEQCDVVKKESGGTDTEPREVGEFGIATQPFEPSPAMMNESCYLEDEDT